MRLPVPPLWLACLFALTAGAYPMIAQGESAAPAPDSRSAELGRLLATPDGQRLLTLLADPGVRRSLTPPEPVAEATPAALFGEGLHDRLAAARRRMVDFAIALPGLPREVGRTLQQADERLPRRAALEVVLCLAAFLIGGSLTDTLFWRATQFWRDRVVQAPMDTTRQRVTLILQRLTFAALVVPAWALGSLGASLAIALPPPVGTLVLGFLLAALPIAVSLVCTRFILAPSAARFRLLPVSTDAARFWHIWLMVLVGLLSLGLQSVAMLAALGLADETAGQLSDLVGLVVVLLGVAALWRSRRHAGCGGHLGYGLAVCGTILLPTIWLTFLVGAAWLGWALVVASVLPALLLLMRRIVTGVVLGPSASQAPSGAPPSQRIPSRPLGPGPVLVERALQCGLIIAACLFLARAWGIDLTWLATSPAAGARTARGMIGAAAVVFVADLAWHGVRAVIDRRLHHAPDLDDEGELRRLARMRTLLPVLRSVLLVAILAIATMTALSAMGLQIAPLLAGASVIGVAIGFGAQAVVRDLLAGTFFLLDDALRVGEYVETGALRGTVESFSLRSVKLRDYKGQLHTVPFGEIKMITNYSREWVSEELTVAVPYDADLEQVEARLAAVSQELSDDPVLGPTILEKLTSLGVSRMVDGGIEIVLLVKTRPGAQFAVRREAYRRIKLAFEAAGIRLALPVVEVVAAAISAEPPAAAATLLRRSA